MADASTEQEYRQILSQFRWAAAVVAALVCGGAIFYHLVEHWSWLNSVYFCVITLATVGYGDFTPHTDLGKLFTIFYVIAGIGVLASFANLLIRRAVLRRKLRR